MVQTRLEDPAVKSSKISVWLANLALAGGIVLARITEGQDRQATPHAARERRRLGWVGWKHVLYRTYEKFNEDRLLSLAAGVVFYSLLALFPAITALVSCYGLFADPVTINDHLALMESIMPHGAYGILSGQITRIASAGAGDLSLAFFLSLAIALWSANAGIKAIIDTLNIAYGVKERRGFIRLNLVSLAFTVGTIVGLLLAIGAVIVLPIVFSYLPFGGFGNEVMTWLRWPALLVLMIAGFAVLYRFGPNRDHARWQWFSAGNLFATLAWLAGSSLLSYYLGNFANYGATYGSLGAAIGLMMWLWMTAIVVLLGAELNSEIEKARRQNANATQNA